MKFKIIIFMYQLAGGGAERTIINIMKHINKEKFEVVLVLGTNRENAYQHLIPSWVRVENLNCDKVRYCLFKLIKLIRKESPKILFTTMYQNNFLLVLASILSLKNIPVVIREANNRTEAGQVGRVNYLLTNLLYNRATKVIALSEGVRDDLITNFKIKKNKIKVIYNLIDIEFIKKEAEEKVSENIFSSKKSIISVGRLTEQKDYRTLLRAFEIVRQHVDIELIILGKGAQLNELRELGRKLNVSEDVKFIGFKSNPYKYMKQADLFVLTSKWEGFGHVIVEAMSLGTPVVVTDCKSGPFEIVGNNEFGKIVEVGNIAEISSNIIELLTDQEQYNDYSSRGKDRAEFFHIKKIIKNYEDEFYKVITNAEQ